MGKPENEIESYLKRQAEKQNFLCYKFVSPGNNGVPDRILIGHGHTVFVELKRPEGKPRELQEAVMETMIKQGALVYIIDTKHDVDALLQYLQNGSNEPPSKKIRAKQKETEYIGKTKKIVRH